MVMTSRYFKQVHAAGKQATVRNGTLVDVVHIPVYLCGSVSAVAKEEVNQYPKILSQVLGRKGQCST